MDINHGFAKAAVENSETSKRRSHLRQRLSRLQQWESSARSRRVAASKRVQRLQIQQQSRTRQLSRQLRLDQQQWQEQGLTEQVIGRLIRKRQGLNHEELMQWRPKELQANENVANEERKLERSCKEQQEVLRALEDLEAKEQLMYELDHRKDQVMTVCKVALTNLAMWVRQQYFPASYAHATWQKLAPFFQLPGTVVAGATTVRVELRLFNDRALNRDLACLCARVNEASPHLPDGRVLHFTLSAPCCILPAQKHCQIP